jgi:hypothetical protein
MRGPILFGSNHGPRERTNQIALIRVRAAILSNQSPELGPRIREDDTKGLSRTALGIREDDEAAVRRRSETVQANEPAQEKEAA